MADASSTNLPRLDQDLFATLVEQVLFQNVKTFEPNDLTESWKSNFMYMNPEGMRAFVFAVSKCKRLNCRYLLQPNAENKDDEFILCKSDNSFNGFSVNREFIYGLIKRRGFRVEVIRAENMFQQLIEPSSLDQMVLSPENNVCSFFRVFLEQGGPSMFDEISGKLNLKQVYITDSYEVLKFMNFVLHLNSSEVIIFVHSDNESDHLYPVPTPPSTSLDFLAENTKNVCITYNINPVLEGESSDLSSDQWIQFINHILNVCPNLSSLKIHVIHQYTELPLCSRLERVWKAAQCMTSDVLPCCKHQYAKVTVEFRDFLDQFERQDLDFTTSKLDQLTTLGEPFEVEDLKADEISRVVKVAASDETGAVEHELVVTLFNNFGDDLNSLNSIELNQVIEDNLDPEYWGCGQAGGGYVYNGYDSDEVDGDDLDCYDDDDFDDDC